MGRSGVKGAWIALALGTAAGAQVPFPADVRLEVRGPDADPLTNTRVVVTNADRDPFHPNTRAVEITTDSQGIARFQFPAGVSRLSIKAPHIGYGTAGLTELIAGQTASPHLPPLTPYGSLDGMLPPEARAPNVVVTAGSYYGDEQISVTPDAAGHFHIADVPSHRWHVWSGAGRNHDFQTTGPITVLPGQAIRNLTLARAPREAPLPLPPGFGPGSTRKVVWARGVVRTDSGRPVSGATVFGLATYFGGRRMNETNAKTKSAADGSYVLEGEGDLPSFNATLLAVAPGMPPAWTWISSPWKAGAEPPTEDLVLPSRAGRLHVAILRDGRPAAGVMVGAYQEYANLRATWALSLGDKDDRRAMEDAAYPIMRTGADGIATFDCLLPGSYRLVASEAGADSVRSLAQSLPVIVEREAYAISLGIAVRTGQTTQHRMTIYPHRDIATFRVLRADGVPLTGDIQMSFSRDGGWSTNAGLDRSGAGKFEFGTAGLWHVEFPFPGTPLNSFPTREPYYSAAGVLAAGNLSPDFSPAFTARRIEPASARVHVQDMEGKPLRASVQIERIPYEPEASGVTGGDGSILFTGLFTVRDDLVRAFAAGLEPVDLGEGESPVPPPAQLRNRAEILAHPLTTVRNSEARIDLRPEPVGYVYGRLRVPPGGNTKDLRLYPDSAGVAQGASAHLRPSTGEYAAGPFRAGPIHLRLATGDAGSEVPVAATVRGGEATLLDIDVPADLSSPAGPSVEMFLGMGGISAYGGRSDLLTGRIFLSDGVSPAAGALVLYFKPGLPQPVLSATADALGNVRAHGLSQVISAVAAGTQIGPASPVLVARLPGSCGATVQPAPPAGQPVRLVLPAAVALRGRVVTPARGGTIRVQAAYQGKDFLDEPLSIETTADAGGYFTLAGLTPGKYQVQAVLDEIWLSRAVAVTVRDRNPTPVELAIAAPGAAVLVHLQNRLGEPAIGAALTIDRPAGPLATALWPREWISDGAGLVYIPTLEAGSHTLHAAGSARPVEVAVPPLPAPRPVEARLTIDAP